MGTIKCGFWKIKFLITPDEFKEILEIADRHNMSFAITNYERTEDHIERVLTEYKIFYEGITSPYNQPKGFFVCGMDLPNITGFHMVHEDLYYFLKNEKWIKEVAGLMISYQKGIAVTDESGKYFIYEDIRVLEPQGYVIYEEIEKKIKSITKPLRISIDGIAKSFLNRISKLAAEDLSRSWLFKENEFEMISFVGKKI